MRSVVVHCHFYQPPREDPWRDVVPPEPAAAPFHDWNARIAHECYEPFGAARVLDAAGEVASRVNLYELVGFDVGATLMHWLERNDTGVYQTILAADAASAKRLGGHGNAIAMPYNHVILPLASRREKVTEVRWGLADFRRRFGRDAEGMWLPETAVDEETLVVLAEEGVRFTILAPHQVENPSTTGVPLRFAAGRGREIALFTYDGTIAHAAAFGRLLEDAGELVSRLAPAADDIVADEMLTHMSSVALDGETFGHHKKFAEMALAGAMTALRENDKILIENYASVLARVPPVDRARVVEFSSWSCAHGIERWRADCACGIVSGTSHAWRRPLRSALNWLAREVDDRFEIEADELFLDAWSTRDAFGTAASLPEIEREAYVATKLRAHVDVVRALELLDAQRARLGMFGSCAWFFDDAAGLEVILMLRLAARAIELIRDDTLEHELLERLSLAVSNDITRRDAAHAYRTHVLPMRQQVTA